MASTVTSRIFPEARTPFRWYDNPMKRYENTWKTKNGMKYKLITLPHYLLPFMIIRQYSPDPITAWVIIDENGSSTNLDISLIEIKSILDKDYIIYKGDDLNISMNCGFFHSEITDGTNTWYSERFYVTPSGECDGRVSDTSHPCSLMIEWGSECDFGNMYYRSGFRNRFFFEEVITLSESTYKITKEVTNDGDGNPTEQLVGRQEIYQIETGLLPKFVVDALVDMSIHPIKRLYMPRCQGSDEIKNVVVVPTWRLDGTNATVKITFAIDEITETGCCDNLEDCLQPCYDAFANPNSACQDEKYYLGQNGTLLYCNNGTLINVPCETGLVRHDADDVTEFPPYWIWNSALEIWDDVPAILDVTQPNIAENIYVITALIVAGTVGQLQISTDGVTFSDVDGAVLDKDNWELEGYTIDLTLYSAGTYYFRVNSFNDVCNYGISEPISFEIVTCITVCTANNYFKVSRHYNSDYIIEFASVMCDGVEQLSSPLIVDLSAMTYSLGLDGVTLYLDNITDALNAILPAGYRCYDDMRVLTHPCGTTFHYAVVAQFPFAGGGGGIAFYDYDYDSSTGYTIDHSATSPYTCV